jgi:hypothetical protein
VITPTIQYFCPHCGRWLSLFSWKPYLQATWPCRGCGARVPLDGPALGGVWGGTFALWSTGLLFLLLTPPLVVLSRRPAVAPLLALIVSFVLSLPAYYLGYTVGRFYIHGTLEGRRRGRRRKGGRAAP